MTCRARTLEALDAIAAAPEAFTRVYDAEALAAADAADARHARGERLSPLDGVLVSIKDLFDVAGEPTPAGSLLLRDAPPAAQDAPVVARLRAAGAVIVGRTHMSGFAFSGLGTNPHLPRLANPHDPDRVPGGSSSGAAVAVALGHTAIGIGSDTGGSTRIPASFCGVVGFKPTQRRVTLEGAFPLSPSLDSVGPIASSVEWCALADSIIADVPEPLHPPVSLGELRLAVPLNYVTETLDDIVGDAFERTLAALTGAGAHIEHTAIPELARIPAMNAQGTISNAESFAFHSASGYLAHTDAYDPNVVRRIEIGRAMSREHYEHLLAERARLIEDTNARTRGYDAMLFPTTPAVAPRFDEITTYETWSQHNGRALRNASVVNLLDRCALSLPMPGARLPAGLTIVGETMDDARLFAIAAAVESCLTAL